MSRDPHSKRSKTVFWIVTGLFAVVGALSLVFGLLSAADWQRFAARFSTDGSVQGLTASRVLILRPFLILFGVWCLRMVLAFLTSRNESVTALDKLSGSIRRFWHRLGTDLRELGTQFSEEKINRSAWLIVLALFVLAILLRAVYLSRPMLHDESYTVTAWASGPLLGILNDYHLPNNHIFHTVLVYLSLHLLGAAPWMVRLPAFLSMALVTPAVFLLGRRLYNATAGLIAAALTAVLPVFVHYAVNARGYPIYMLFTVLGLWLAARALRSTNLWNWLLLALIAALGFWTVPMMLYPFGAICVWIALSAFFDKTAQAVYGSKMRIIRYLVLTGLFTILLTLIFYSPLLYRTGTSQLFGNNFIEPLSRADWWETMRASRLPELWAEWTWGIGILGGILLLLGIVFSAALPRRSSKYTVHTLAALLLWFIPLIILQRPNLWSRVFSFIYPLTCVWAAAGWSKLLSRTPVGSRTPGSSRLTRLASALLLVLVIAGSALNLYTWRDECPGFRCRLGDEQEAALYLEPLLNPEDAVVIGYPNDTPFGYYLYAKGYSLEPMRKSRSFTHAWVIVNPAEDQTVESVLAERGPGDAGWVQGSQSLVQQFTRLQVWSVQGTGQTSAP